MKKIPLSQNGKNKGKFFAIVDDADYEWLNQWRWYLVKCGNKQYVKRIEYPQIFIHRLILNTPKGKDTDHLNENGLDNRKQNLRICTKSENQMNRGKTKNNTSGIKGIRWHKVAKKWESYITKNQKRINLGYFKDKEEAAKVYNEAAKKYFGEFARLNIIK